MAGETQEVLSDLQGLIGEMTDDAELIWLTVNTPQGRTFKAGFQANDESAMSRYRNLYSGGLRKKRGNPVAAVHFLFEKKFVKTDIEWGDALKEKGHANEKEYFLKSRKGKLFMDSMVNGYLGAEQMDVDDLNA